MEKFEEFVKELLEKMGISNASVSSLDQNGSLLLKIESEDEKSLVGRDNDRLHAITHLIKRIFAKKFGEEKKVHVDVNNSKEKSDDALKARATMIAERAKMFKTDVPMEGLSSYERMVVHAHLQEMPFIKTESVGEGHARKLVVKYIEE